MIDILDFNYNDNDDDDDEFNYFKCFVGQYNKRALYFSPNLSPQ